MSETKSVYRYGEENERNIRDAGERRGWGWGGEAGNRRKTDSSTIPTKVACPVSSTEVAKISFSGITEQYQERSEDRAFARDTLPRVRAETATSKLCYGLLCNPHVIHTNFIYSRKLRRSRRDSRETRKMSLIRSEECRTLSLFALAPIRLLSVFQYDYYNRLSVGGRINNGKLTILSGKCIIVKSTSILGPIRLE